MSRELLSPSLAKNFRGGKFRSLRGSFFAARVGLKGKGGDLSPSPVKNFRGDDFRSLRGSFFAARGGLKGKGGEWTGGFREKSWIELISCFWA
jgi:hypothetical protein